MHGNRESSIIIEDMKISVYLSKIVLHESKITNISTHAHLYNELFVCTEGKISIATDSEIFELNAGDAAIIPTGVFHHKLDSKVFAKWSSAAFTLQRYYARNSSKLWKNVENKCQEKEISIFKNVPEFCEKIDTINNSFEFDEPSLPALRVALLLIELINSHQVKKTKNLHLPLSGSDIDRAVSLEFILERYYMQDITISDFAEKLNISTRQLSRIIKNKYGTTFHKILTEKRLKAAAFLLVTGNDSIDTICRLTGFNSSSSFYKKFSERYNMTPAEYRISNKNSI